MRTMYFSSSSSSGFDYLLLDLVFLLLLLGPISDEPEEPSVMMEIGYVQKHLIVVFYIFYLVVSKNVSGRVRPCHIRKITKKKIEHYPVVSRTCLGVSVVCPY